MVRRQAARGPKVHLLEFLSTAGVRFVAAFSRNPRIYVSRSPDKFCQSTSIETSPRGMCVDLSGAARTCVPPDEVNCVCAGFSCPRFHGGPDILMRPCYELRMVQSEIR